VCVCVCVLNSKKCWCQFDLA